MACVNDRSNHRQSMPFLWVDDTFRLVFLLFLLMAAELLPPGLLSSHFSSQTLTAWLEPHPPFLQVPPFLQEPPLVLPSLSLQLVSWLVPVSVLEQACHPCSFPATAAKAVSLRFLKPIYHLCSTLNPILVETYLRQLQTVSLPFRHCQKVVINNPANPVCMNMASGWVEWNQVTNEVFGIAINFVLPAAIQWSKDALEHRRRRQIQEASPTSTWGHLCSTLW